MRTPEQAARKVISAKDVYVGIDVHKESGTSPYVVTERRDSMAAFPGSTSH